MRLQKTLRISYKNIVCLLFVLLLSNHLVQAKHRSVWSNQGRKIRKNYFDLGVCTGLGNYYGDIVPTFFSFRQLHPDMGIFARYNIGQYIAFRSTAIYGAISGDDKYYNNAPRNLSFRSNIEELGFTMEINLKPYHAFNRRKSGFAPYLFFGIAGFHFNPKAEYNGTWYELQPLGTEGEGLPGYAPKYSTFGISLPIGGGLKYRLETSYNNYITIGAEFGIRKTFTDYLDDVSRTQYVSLDSLGKGSMSANLSWREDELPPYRKGQFFPDIRRGNPDNKDWYYFGNITVSYVFGNKRISFEH